MTVTRFRAILMAVENLLRGRGFGLQARPVGDLAVPLDQGRNRSTLCDDGREQIPDDVSDGTIVAIDQQRFTFVVGLCGVTGEVNLANAPEWKVAQVFSRRESVIGC